MSPCFQFNNPYFSFLERLKYFGNLCIELSENISPVTRKKALYKCKKSFVNLKREAMERGKVGKKVGKKGKFHNTPQKNLEGKKVEVWLSSCHRSVTYKPKIKK